MRRDAHPVAVIMKRLIGKLRRGDPEFALLRETLRQDGVEFSPEPVFIPILENPIALGSFRGRSRL